MGLDVYLCGNLESTDSPPVYGLLKSLTDYLAADPPRLPTLSRLAYEDHGVVSPEDILEELRQIRGLLRSVVRPFYTTRKRSDEIDASSLRFHRKLLPPHPRLLPYECQVVADGSPIGYHPALLSGNRKLHLVDAGEREILLEADWREFAVISGERFSWGKRQLFVDGKCVKDAPRAFWRSPVMATKIEFAEISVLAAWVDDIDSFEALARRAVVFGKDLKFSG
jgi:hypothetical protein